MDSIKEEVKSALVNVIQADVPESGYQGYFSNFRKITLMVNAYGNTNAITSAYTTITAPTASAIISKDLYSSFLSIFCSP